MASRYPDLRGSLMRVAVALSLIHSVVPAAADDQSGGEYAPDLAVFDGSNTLRFASNPLLSLVNGGVVEFWVAPDWREDPGYAPIVLSNQADQPIYEISISGARDAIGIQAGGEYGRIEYDFSDGEMHHVAILDFIDSVYVMVGGEIVGAMAMSFADTPGTDLWIGAGHDNVRPFKGAVAGVRIWEGAIPVETIAAYALRDPRDAGSPHPSLDALIGESDFRSNDFVVANTVEVTLDPEVLAVQQE